MNDSPVFPSAADDTGLRVIATGVAVEEVDAQAFEPAVTRAPNGDLVLCYATGLDGGDSESVIKLARSTDNGASWSSPSTIRRPQVFPDGGMSVAVGMTTLRDGTILLPFSEAITHHRFLNRESLAFVARSTDNGHSWQGLDEPIQADTTRLQRFPYGRIIELADGSVLLPAWGMAKLRPNWERDPEPSSVELLRSDDAGRTWTTLSTIAADPLAPGRFRGDPMSTGPNETSVLMLDDGRLLAVIRYEMNRHPVGMPMYVAHSDDNGATWSHPQQMAIRGGSPSLAALPGAGHRIVLGYRNSGDTNHDRLGHAALSVSYDGGATWEGKTYLEDPDGPHRDNFTGSYPDYVSVADDQILALFMNRTRDGRFRIAFNLLQDVGSAAAPTETMSIYVDRQDRENLPFYAGAAFLTVPADIKAGDVLARATEKLSCHGERMELRHRGLALSSVDTLSKQGVVSGDVLTVCRPEKADQSIVLGYRDFDRYPDSSSLGGWNSRFDQVLGLDGQQRSVGGHIPSAVTDPIISIELRGDAQDTRLSADDYRIWASHDNSTFEEIKGWKFATDNPDGETSHVFSGLEIAAPYFKISQPHEGTDFTFVLNDIGTAIRVRQASNLS